jgi:hypothetical protein
VPLGSRQVTSQPECMRGTVSMGVGPCFGCGGPGGFTRPPAPETTGPLLDTLLPNMSTGEKKLFIKLDIAYPRVNAI